MGVIKETTANELDHYFGNFVGRVRHFHIGEINTFDFESNREKFIEGLERALTEEVPEERGTTRDHLREMVNLAQGDWSSISAIKALYRKYYEIREVDFGKYDEQKLFYGR